MLVSAVINTTAHVAAIILFIIAVLVFAMFIFRVSRSDDNDLGPSDGAKL
jgi:heme/copper-type cytochrome/quinol oxidase subunit 2